MTLKREPSSELAENKSVIVGHVIAGFGHTDNQCDNHKSPAIPEISSARAATAARIATHSGQVRRMVYSVGASGTMSARPWAAVRIDSSIAMASAGSASMASA